MRALGLAGLLVALAIVGLSMRSQLRAVRRAAPSASAPAGPASAPALAGFQQELDRQMRGAAQRAASAGADSRDMP